MGRSDVLSGEGHLVTTMSWSCQETRGEMGGETVVFFSPKGKTFHCHLRFDAQREGFVGVGDKSVRCVKETFDPNSLFGSSCIPDLP